MSGFGDVDFLRELLKPIATTGDLQIGLVEGGWRIKRTDWHYIDVLRMLFSFRVVTTPINFPAVYDRHWCYNGNDAATLIRAVVAAAMWDGRDDTEPTGWNKNGQTKEFVEPH